MIKFLLFLYLVSESMARKFWLGDTFLRLEKNGGKEGMGARRELYVIV